MDKYFTCSGCKHESEYKHLHYTVSTRPAGTIIARYCANCWDVMIIDHAALAGDA